MLSFHAIEDVCEKYRTALVIHPDIRRAIRGSEKSFYLSLCCFLKGEANGVYSLPLQTGGYELLIFSKRRSAGGYYLLRIDPVRLDGRARIKASLIGSAANR